MGGNGGKSEKSKLTRLWGRLAWDGVGSACTLIFNFLFMFFPRILVSREAHSSIIKQYREAKL